MPNLVNKLTVQLYERSFAGAESLVVCSLDGLSVAESDALRGKLEERGVDLALVRNRLADRVLKERGYAFEGGVWRGNTAVAWGGDSEAAILAAKVLTEPALQKPGKVRVKGGVMEGRQLGAADAAALADVPDRETLNARLLGTLQGPARGLAGVVQGPLGALARVLQARIDREGGAAGA